MLLERGILVVIFNLNREKFEKNKDLSKFSKGKLLSFIKGHFQEGENTSRSCHKDFIAKFISKWVLSKQWAWAMGCVKEN
mgnify:FL=1